MRTVPNRRPACRPGRLFVRLAPVLAALLFVVTPAQPGRAAGDGDTTPQTAPPPTAQPQPGSGLPVPRFVSLRSNEVNLRTGPGLRYPIQWVYVHKGLPMEITAEFDTWRRVRDWQGTEGWVHESTLSGLRTMIITGKPRGLHTRPSDGSGLVARLAPGVVGRLLSCRPRWCQVDAKGFQGWLKRDAFWGVLPNETLE